MKKRVTLKKIERLLQLIKRAVNISDEAKKICLDLVAASVNLTKPVYITIFSEECAHDIKAFLSLESGNPNKFLSAIGSDYHFQQQKGSFSEIGQFQFNLHPGKAFAYTIWLCSEWCDDNAIEAPRL